MRREERLPHSDRTFAANPRVQSSRATATVVASQPNMPTHSRTVRPTCINCC